MEKIDSKTYTERLKIINEEDDKLDAEIIKLNKKKLKLREKRNKLFDLLKK